MASGPTPEALDGDHAAGSRPPPPAADDFTSEHASAALDERAHTALANGGSAAQHTVAIFVDGSAHGGQRARDGGKPSREEQWRQAQAEEYALEARSLGDERSVHSGRHLALWVLEDGSVRGGGSVRNGSVRNGSVRNSSVHGGPKGKVSGFGGAVVQVEEPDDAEVFEWGAYFGSLPKKLKGQPEHQVALKRLLPHMRSTLAAQGRCWVTHAARTAPTTTPLPLRGRSCLQAGWTRGCPFRPGATWPGAGSDPSWVSPAAEGACRSRSAALHPARCGCCACWLGPAPCACLP